MAVSLRDLVAIFANSIFVPRNAHLNTARERQGSDQLLVITSIYRYQNTWPMKSTLISTEASYDFEDYGTVSFLNNIGMSILCHKDIVFEDKSIQSFVNIWSVPV
jgi:hypothetical protein